MLVKDMATTSFASTFFSSIKTLMRSVNTRVLPDAAAARQRILGSSAYITFFYLVLKFIRPLLQFQSYNYYIIKKEKSQSFKIDFPTLLYLFYLQLFLMS